MFELEQKKNDQNIRSYLYIYGRENAYTWFTQVHICTISLTSNCIQTRACREKLISDLKSAPKTLSKSVKISNATQNY